MLNYILTAALTVACLVLACAILRPREPVTSNISASQTAAEPSWAPRSPADDQAMLRRRIDRIWLTDVTLDDALLKLSELTKVNLCADWRTLEIAGLSRKHLLRVHLENVTLAEALTVALKDLVEPNGHAFGYVVSDGIVTITTTEEAPQMTQRGFFNIRPLIDELTGGPEGRWSRLTGQWGPIDEVAVDEITALITTEIAPDSWRNNGGPSGNIGDINGILVVTQTPENLAAVRRLLDLLHRVITTSDFAPTATTSPAAGAGADKTGSAPSSSQLATGLFNIRPLIDAARSKRGPATSPADPDNNPRDADPIVATLIASIDPDSWNLGHVPSAGRHGRILEMGGILVIRQTPANLRAVRTMLEKMRRGG